MKRRAEKLKELAQRQRGVRDEYLKRLEDFDCVDLEDAKAHLKELRRELAIAIEEFDELKSNYEKQFASETGSDD